MYISVVYRNYRTLYFWLTGKGYIFIVFKKDTIKNLKYNTRKMSINSAFHRTHPRTDIIL